jgi:hypothetical protein
MSEHEHAGLQQAGAASFDKGHVSKLKKEKTR